MAADQPHCIARSLLLRTLHPLSIPAFLVIVTLAFVGDVGGFERLDRVL